MFTLNSSFLFQKLSEKYNIKRSSATFSIPVFAATLYAASVEPRSGYIYLLSSEDPYTDFSKFPPDSLIIWTANEDAPLFPNIWHIRDSVSTASLLQHIQEIMLNVQNWYFEIINLRFKENCLQKIIERSVFIFGRPLMLINTELQILAYCPKRTPHSIRSSGLPYSSLPDMTSAVKFNVQQNHEQEYDLYYFSSTLFENRDLVCVNIKINGITEYRLLLLDCSKQESDIWGPLLASLADVLYEELARRPLSFYSKDRRLHSVFKKILSGKSTDYVVNSQILEGLGWSSANEYSVMLLHSAFINPQSSASASICTKIESTSPTALCSFVFQDQIVTFINHSLLSMNYSTIQSQFSTIIRDNLLKAAYSRVLLGHFNFYRQYKQARLTLMLGERLAPTIWIYRFNDFSFDYIISSITKSLPAYMVSHEKLLLMKYYDEQQETQYYETLRCYLDNHMNAAQTAKDLYIHRSTFLHRLEKIKELLQSQLENPDEILYLMISFRLNDSENASSSTKIDRK